MSTSNLSSPKTASDQVTGYQIARQVAEFAGDRSATRQNRRNFLTGLATAAAAAGTLGIAGCSNDGPITTTTTTSSAPSVTDVLNFALNLEYLEANFYTYLATGQPLSSTNNGGSPTITGGAQYTSSNPTVNLLLTNLYQEETAHVALLRATIQSAFNVTPVACPNLNLAAMGSITSDSQLIALARQVEGVGVSAYAGGAQYLTSSVAALNYAAQILHVEAQHSGLMRQLCIQYSITSPAADSQDTPPSASAVFNVNSQGFNPLRTPQQVLGIVYGVSTSTTTTPPAGTTSGGFFPNGMNGNIKST